MDTKPIVLIVDDVELNRAFLNDMLEDEYTILEASDGSQAVDYLEKYKDQIDVVLLDVVMPVMDGFEVLAVMNERGWIENIPVIMISAETSADYTNRGFNMGVTDYISRPFDSCIIRHRIKNTIMLYAKQRALQGIVRQQIREKEKNNTLMVDVLSSIVEFRNGESGLHVLRIRVITEFLLKAFVKFNPQCGLTYSEITHISNAAALHDIGKIAIPEHILNKPGKLTSEEYKEMQKHAALGADMLKEMQLGHKEALIRYAHDICRWHHERWDGRGYPDGLAGDAIPLSAQVVSLADVYDALISERIYKPAFSHKKAMEMILHGERGQFNPELLVCLEKIGDDLEKKLSEEVEMGQDLTCVEKVSREVLDQKPALGPSDRTMYLLEKERIKYQFLAALSNEILFEYDLKEDTLVFSERAHTELGIEVMINDMMHRSKGAGILSEKDGADIWKCIFSTTHAEPFFRQQYMVTLPGGQKQWYEFILRSLWSNELEPRCVGFIGRMSNIHNQKVEAARLRDMAERDSLTKLYNRTTAKRLVEEFLEASKGDMAVMLFFDMDQFKTVNDTYGHAFGDELLKLVASTVRTNIRQDDIAARVGGDEFVIFLKRIRNRQDAENKADQLCQALQGELHGCGFSASIGAAVYKEDGSDYQTLLHHADIALYKAKRAGKNRYAFYDRSDNEQVLQQKTL